MAYRFTIKNIGLLYSAFAIFLSAQTFSAPQGNDLAPLKISSTKTSSQIKTELVVPGNYVVDLVATASFGVDMNDAGDVIGTSYPDPGCGSTCLPPLETVVWKDGIRIVLPTVPGLSGITLTDINNQGWICGFAGLQGTITHAVVWKPNGNLYTAIDLGNLPGKSISTAIGIDDFGRVIGWSTTQNFPPIGAPFMWSEAGGMIDLTTQGFPNESPLGISPGGTVAVYGYWYRLDDPGSITAIAPPPAGFGIENSTVAINDAGDQARFLVTIGSENLDYPFRYNHQGTWQQISFLPTGHLSSYGVGSITDAGDITATVQGIGMIAYGPNELAQPLAPLVSAAYGGSVLTSAGQINANGEILARMIIGQSGQRLVRLIPGEPCITNCIQVSSILMKGRGPAFCNQGNAKVRARVTVTDEAGIKLSGVTVTGHFFDDYWLDETVVGTTNAQGSVTFTHIGPPCIGAIAFLITDAATAPPRTLDRTTGILTNHIIPLPPGNNSDVEESLDFDDDLEIDNIQSKIALDIPINFGVAQNYPNPFNPSTIISFSIPEKSFVTLKIYDMLGKEVTELVNEELETGSFEKTFDASSLSSGVYIYRISAMKDGKILFNESKQMMLIK